MNETLLTILIPMVTGILTTIITSGTQIYVQTMKMDASEHLTFREQLKIINKWLVLSVSGASVIVMAIFVLAIMPKNQEYSAIISAECPDFTTTKVYIEQGDEVEIIVQGEDTFWDCGRGPIGPAGYFNEKYPDHFLPSANACELIGYLDQPEVYFRVGYYTHFTAEDSGILYLGINDAISQCSGNPASTIPVKIFVQK